jgi:hypothetical protein
MGLLIYLATLLPGLVLAFTAARRGGGAVGWLLPIAVVGYLVGAKVGAFFRAWDPRAMPVWAELVAPWRAPLEQLPAAAGATFAIALGVIALRRAGR